MAAIKGTVAGGAYTDPAVTGKLLRAVADQQSTQATFIADKLTERETDVLRILARGLNNAAIAEELHLTEGTVRNYISAILAKFEMRVGPNPGGCNCRYTWHSLSFGTQPNVPQKLPNIGSC